MNTRTLITIASISLLAACGKNSNKNSETQDSAIVQEQKTEVRKTNIIRKAIIIPHDFSYITNIGSIDIIYSQGDYSIEVEGDSALLEYVNTNFDSNLLTVSIKSDANTDYNYYGNQNNIKMFISAPELHCISICSTGGFDCDDTLNGDDVQIGVLGTGNIHMKDLKCKSLLIESTGDGDVSIDHLTADVATLNSRSSSTFTIDCDVKDFAIINEGKQTINLSGTIEKKTISNKKDKKLNDKTR